jgi:predicted glycoside hydrolase/deacetylase ChbG (UPF0249 family)
LPLSHIDGHLHLHVHPVIFNIALELCSQYGARRMRVPVEERRLAIEFDRRDVMRKTIHAMLFGGLGVYMKRKLSQRGFTFPEHVYGNLQSGRMSEQYFLYVLDTLSADTTEIYFHPACFRDDKLLNPDEYQCSIEFEALMSGLVKQRIDELGVSLTTYSEIEHERESRRSEYRL